MFDALSKEQQKKTGKRNGIIKQGEKMHCVDWREKHVPHLWKIYQMQETDDLDSKTGEPISRFIKVDEDADRDKALARAKTLRAGM